jgi:hypothetical protein
MPTVPPTGGVVSEEEQKRGLEEGVEKGTAKAAAVQEVQRQKLSNADCATLTVMKEGEWLGGGTLRKVQRKKWQALQGQLGSR